MRRAPTSWPSFAPVQATSGGRIVAARAQEAIMYRRPRESARVLPAIDDWIKRRNARD